METGCWRGIPGEAERARVGVRIGHHRGSIFPLRALSSTLDTNRGGSFERNREREDKREREGGRTWDTRIEEEEKITRKY